MFREGDLPPLEFNYNSTTLPPPYSLSVPREQVPEFLKNPFPEGDEPPSVRVPSPSSPSFGRERPLFLEPQRRRDDEVESSSEEDERAVRRKSSSTFPISKNLEVKIGVLTILPYSERRAADTEKDEVDKTTQE